MGEHSLRIVLVALVAACGQPSPGAPDGGASGPDARTINGTVSGLSGTNLVLQDNGGDDLTVTANGAFTFATPIASGAAYSVTVVEEPTSPSQHCTVSGGSGTVANANIVSVDVSCAFAPWATVASGFEDACATRTDGTLWCWGFNSSGQLGDGTVTPPQSATQQISPEQIGTTTTWAAVVAGAEHVCATRTDGTLWCWGGNFGGQVGDGTTTDAHAPEQIGSATSWATVAGGGAHTCATRSDGTLWCWGSNNSGQLGDGTTTDAHAPEQVGSATTWATVAAGHLHTCATRTDGTLWCWGGNNSGQLGDATTTFQPAPEQIGSATTWSAVAAGDGSTCATRTDGTLWCWGGNSNGQLGDGTTIDAHAPEQIGSTTTWATVAGIYTHSCATRTDGTLWCWGQNFNGQLGDGTTTDAHAPEQVGSAITWTTVVTAGEGNTCATATDGTLWCWGSNGYGEIGNGDTAQRATPVQVEP